MSEEVEDRFCKELEFGTGGIRGVIGAGTNRMNRYTVRKATQGLANYILSQGEQAKGVAIAYDSRRFSNEFSKEAALCLAANGIKAYLFDALRPTPELSFAVRELGAIAGIVVTASHNPPEYNGYKVYWADGAQITAPRDAQIIKMVNEVTDYEMVLTMEESDALAAGLVEIIGKEIDDAYMEALKKQQIHPELVNKMAKELKIVYSPLHGSGNMPVCRILEEIGFEQVYVVAEQKEPDEAFSTIQYPNPEDPEAFTLALKLAKKVGADIILATDPDADRLGVYALDQKTGDYIPFTGNMTGVLLTDYLLREKSITNTLPANPVVVKTIVTTNMLDALVAAYPVELVQVLTGFKYIGEQIALYEKSENKQFVFGMEESYGCLVGTHARDKDAVVATMCLCEVAAFCKNQGETLWDQMLSLYETYGYYQEGLHTITLKGIAGTAKIIEIMANLRENPCAQIGDFQVAAVRDYKSGQRLTLVDGVKTKMNLPESNVLYMELDRDAWCCVRPSGTEPKIKFYMGVKGDSLRDAEQMLAKLKQALIALVPTD